MTTDPIEPISTDTASDQTASDLAVLESKIKELEAGWQRTAADFQNYRKRIESERELLIKFASSDLIAALLPVLDNMHLAVEHVPNKAHKEQPEWTAGIKAVCKQLEDILAKQGLEPIKTSVGDPFNPAEHEAISTQQETKIKPDHIAAIISNGYRLHGRILRPTKVKVSANKP